MANVTKCASQSGSFGAPSNPLNGLSGSFGAPSNPLNGLSGSLNGLSGSLNGLSGSLNGLSGSFGIWGPLKDFGVGPYLFVWTPMERLRENLETIRSLRERVKAKDATLFSHAISEKNPVSAETTISVVMTAHSRSAQVYFTLDMMKRSPACEDLQVIIVDDSQVDAVSMDQLRTYPFTIELITISKEAKTWANPCVNYNIGLEHVRGAKLLLQNGECCHVGDVLSYVASPRITDGMYYAFDVKAALNEYMNSLLYSHGRANGLQIDVYQEEIYYVWYQHHIHRNAHYHFMTAMTMKTYREIIPDGFSYDYAFGMDYDDDDLLLQIKTRALPLICIKHEVTGVGGIHLWHSKGDEIGDVRAYTAPSNQALYQHKMSYTCYKGIYPELSRVETLDASNQLYDSLITHASATHRT